MIVGVLLIVGILEFVIYMNVIVFFLLGFIILFLLNFDKKEDLDIISNILLFIVLKKDWNIVINFSRKYVYVVCVYFLF